MACRRLAGSNHFGNSRDMSEHHQSIAETNQRALLVGHFSTVGDVEVLRQTERQLQALGMAYDVTPYTDAREAVDSTWLNRFTLDPARYSHLFVICGPFTPAMAVQHESIFDRFKHCVHIGVNLTMVEPLATFNPFEVLLERDSDRTVRADLSFREAPSRVPVIGLCLTGFQREYGDRHRGALAEEKLRRLIKNSGAAVIEMDTSVPAAMNRFGLSNAAQFESICARLDAMLTTRLHGMVLALKNGIPTIAIDPVAGGDKVTRQAHKLGWREVFEPDQVSDDDLLAALTRCLSEAGRADAGLVRDRAIASLDGFDEELAMALQARPDLGLRDDLIPKVGMVLGLRKRFKAWKRRRRAQNRV
ncbi:polysaccharide pyruvyl transferase family protein (plasmid) [Paracoccus liaowanqingii]|uniref:Polysaccharide pyruvyl transferase family protein n=2 Tax=Paracoccus liaowanqingii TaxID=2560053 RepID=A0A4Y5STQ2_9RHOB|nr:polysaccharide pyruvyl transferase family protein [Paracoccus liaowanqingii]